MKIYTKTGDAGETGLFAGGRVAKDHPRIEAFGTVDELNAAIGLARTADLPQPVQDTLGRVQNELFNLGAELATPKASADVPRVQPAAIETLERAIDSLEGELPPLTQFILPGGTPAAGLLHLARGICRRSERRVVTLAAEPNESISPLVVQYINRLGDYLFVAARYTNKAAGVSDVPWQK